MRLVIVLGTRPEIIRLSTTINLARKCFDVTLVHTGQNYDDNLSGIFFGDLNIDRPDIYLNCSRKNIGETIGDIISKTYELFLELRPDALLILGDTNSSLCCYNAKRLKIPIFHIEAGNRCFDPNVPEEINRRIVDHLSDINICYMEHARRNLLKENFNSQFIFVVGSPIRELALYTKYKVDKSVILDKLDLKRDEYFVWSSHREENIDNSENFHNVVNSINMIASKYNKKILFSVHPRTRNKITRSNIVFNSNVVLSEPLGLSDYYKLQQNALCVISDSGTVTEESCVLKFRAVLLRTSTEHPEGIDAGSIVIGNNNWKYLEEAIELCLQLDLSKSNIDDYNALNFSEKVCKIIVGYFHLVDKFVWMKSPNREVRSDEERNTGPTEIQNTTITEKGSEEVAT